MSFTQLKKEDSEYNLPEWFWDSSFELINHPDFLYDVVYNFYQCQNCIIQHQDDIERPQRIKSIYTNNIKKSELVCECSQNSKFLTKLKVCSECRDVFIGDKIRKGICKGCKKDRGDRVFIQNGKIVKHVTYYSFTEPLCVNRSKCLEASFAFTNRNAHICCWDCCNLKLPRGI